MPTIMLTDPAKIADKFNKVNEEKRVYNFDDNSTLTINNVTEIYVRSGVHYITSKQANFSEEEGGVPHTIGYIIYVHPRYATHVRFIKMDFGPGGYWSAVPEEEWE